MRRSLALSLPLQLVFPGSEFNLVLVEKVKTLQLILSLSSLSDKEAK